jgi:hypothetical protein
VVTSVQEEQRHDRFFVRKSGAIFPSATQAWRRTERIRHKKQYNGMDAATQHHFLPGQKYRCGTFGRLPVTASG